MKKGELSRQKLVDATSALLQRQGFHATGLAQIVEESGAPRGSLYFYFPGGKEELACAALEASGERWREALSQVVGASDDPGEAVVAACRALADALASSGFEQGCPLATVALEASSQSEPVRQTVARHYEAWASLIEERLVASGVEPSASTSAASFVLSAIEGALLLAKVGRSKAPLLDAGASLRAYLSTLAPKKRARPKGR